MTTRKAKRKWSACSVFICFKKKLNEGVIFKRFNNFSLAVATESDTMKNFLLISIFVISFKIYGKFQLKVNFFFKYFYYCQFALTVILKTTMLKAESRNFCFVETTIVQCGGLKFSINMS